MTAPRAAAAPDPRAAALRAVLGSVRIEDFVGRRPPRRATRAGAVLLLFGPCPGADPGLDVLLIERAHDMRSHAGQPAFPGGAVDPEDGSAVQAALREAAEETGVEPDGVDVLGTLPDLWVPPSDFVVTPVVGWWREPGPVRAVDPREVASVHRVPVAELADPANRVRVRHPSGYVGPAFLVAGLVVWGFTGGVLDRLLAVAGWDRPWDPSRVVDLPPAAGATPPPVPPVQVRP